MTSIILSPDTAPVTPEEGEIYYDSGDDKLKVRDASGFREVVSENSSGEIDGTFSGTVSSSATIQGTVGGLDIANSTFNGVLGGTVSFPSGHVLQVQSSYKQDLFTTSSQQTFVDVTGTDQNGNGSVFCVKITPSSTSNKILVMASGVITVSHQYGTANLRVVRDTTVINVGNHSTGTPMALHIHERTAGTGATYVAHNFTTHHLDSPSSTSELTYKFQLSQQTGVNSNVIYLNSQPSPWAQTPSTPSNITVMEIAG